MVGVRDSMLIIGYTAGMGLRGGCGVKLLDLGVIGFAGVRDSELAGPIDLWQSYDLAQRDRKGRTLKPLPTVLRAGPCRLFFYSADRDEPPHVHLERDEATAKFGSNRSDWREAARRHPPCPRRQARFPRSFSWLSF